MKHDERSTRRHNGGTVLWTPWGPVPDASGRPAGKVSWLQSRAKTPRHKNVGFDSVKPRDSLPRQ